MEVSELFADDKLNRFQICHLLATIREKLGIFPESGYASTPPKYNIEQQRQMIGYYNSHYNLYVTHQNNFNFKRFPVEVLETC